MSVTLTIDGADVSHLARWDVIIEVGREDVDSQPDANILNATIDGWRSGGSVGNPVVLADDLGQLFAGTITDLQADLTPDESGRDGTWSTRLTAASHLADLGRVVIGDEPWPEESDSARVQRILDLAGAAHTVDPAILGPNILARDVDSRPALELAQEVAADALGVLWDDPADAVAPIRYTPQRLRAWGPVSTTWGELGPTLTWATINPTLTWGTMQSVTGTALTLSARHVLAELTFDMRIGDLIRKARVTYGLAPDENTPRPEAEQGTGIPEVTLDTQLATNGDALAVAESIVRSRREPKWRTSNVTVPLSQLPGEVQTNIRDALAIGTRLTLTDIDFTSPVGTTWEGFIEGWTHELSDEGSHTLTLNVSGRGLSEPADRWQDIPPGTTWATIPAALTWQTASDWS